MSQTVADCIDKASGAKKPRKIDKHLKAGVRLASSHRDYVDIANAYAELLDDHRAAKKWFEVARESMRDDDNDMFVYRGLAEAFVKLGEPTKAAEALDAGRRRVAAHPGYTPVSDLCLLADFHVMLLDDKDGARRCLDDAMPHVGGPGELAEIASVYASELDDKDTAQTLVNAALGMAIAASVEDGTGGDNEDEDDDAEVDAYAWWNIANVQVDDLEDPKGGKNTLVRALDYFADADNIATLGRAWHGHFGGAPDDDGQGFSTFLDAAAEVADSAENWLSLAETVFDCSGETEAISVYLQKALAAADDDDERQAAAAGYRNFLDDNDTANDIAPSGQTPDALATKRRALHDWQADPKALFDLLRARVTDKMLDAIASADYGMDHDKNLRALRAIRDDGQVPTPIPWNPLEVLELRRWREGEQVDHVERAFVCAVLCIEACTDDYHDGVEQTIAVLLESCLALGSEETAACLALFVAMVEAAETWEERYLFGKLGMALAQAGLDPTDKRLADLVARLIEVEADHAEDGYADAGHGWLLGTTFFDQRHALWRELASTILGDATETSPAPAHLADLRDRLTTAKRVTG